MRKKELTDLVVERSGMNKKDVKPIVEVTLAILGKALAEARELNLQPIGKVKVRCEKLMPNGRVLVTKIHQFNAAEGVDNDADDASDMPDAAE